MKAKAPIRAKTAEGRGRMPLDAPAPSPGIVPRWSERRLPEELATLACRLRTPWAYPAEALFLLPDIVPKAALRKMQSCPFREVAKQHDLQSLAPRIREKPQQAMPRIPKSRDIARVTLAIGCRAFSNRGPSRRMELYVYTCMHAYKYICKSPSRMIYLSKTRIDLYVLRVDEGFSKNALVQKGPQTLL